MRTITLEEFLAELKGQGVPKLHLAFRCPACRTIQSAADLIAAGAGTTFDEVERYLGFSCVGRFTHRKPPPIPSREDFQKGCDWTLGGLLPIHDLQVQTADGLCHPRFEPCTPEEAKIHACVRHGVTERQLLAFAQKLAETEKSACSAT
jgi:hypothetical protein